MIAFATAFVGSLVLLNYPEEGPVVATFSSSHGLHSGDLVLLGIWVLVVGSMVVLARRPGRRRD